MQTFISSNKRNSVLRIAMAMLLSLLAHGFIIWTIGGRIVEDYINSKLVNVSKVLQVSINRQPMVVKQENTMKQKVPPPKVEKPALPTTQPQDKPELVKEKNQIAFKPKKSEAEPAAVPLTFDPTYYVWREIDVPALLRRDNNVPFPMELRDFPERLNIFIELWIDESGKVETVKINQPLPSDDLEKIIVSYYKKLRFTPAMKDGKVKRFRTPVVLEIGDPSRPPGERDEGKSSSRATQD